MAISQEALLKALKNVRKPLETPVNNARLRRVLRRIRNEGEDLADLGDIEELDDEGGEEDGGEVGVGDVVEVEIPQGTTVTAQIVDTEPQEEIVEETEIVDDGDEGDDDEEVVENRRQYRRVKNARIIRTKNGALDVLVPVASSRCSGGKCGGGRKKVKNVRRYKVRSTRNAGYDPETAYAKKIPSDGIDSFATVVNKAKKYDRLVANATIDAAIDEAIKKALQANGVANTASAPKKARPIGKVRNTRRFFNEDEDGGEGTGAGAGDAGLDFVPAESDAPFVDEAQGAIVIPLSDTEMSSLADELDEATEGAEAPAEGGEDVVAENARRIINRRIGKARITNRASALKNARERQARLAKLRNARLAKLRNARLAKLRNSRVGALSPARIAKLRNARMNKIREARMARTRNARLGTSIAERIKNARMRKETVVKNEANTKITGDISLGLDIPSTFPTE